MITLIDLIKFQKTHKFSKDKIILDSCSTILNQEKFFTSHLKMIRNNRGNKLFMPYFERLQQYYLIKTQENAKST